MTYQSIISLCYPFETMPTGDRSVHTDFAQLFIASCREHFTHYYSPSYCGYQRLGAIGLFTERNACWEKGKISRFRHHAASNFARFYRGLSSQQSLSPERKQRCYISLVHIDKILGLQRLRNSNMYFDLLSHNLFI